MSGLPYSYEEWGAMGEFVELPEGRVFAIRTGSGEPLVLVHSFGGNSWMFSRVLDALAASYTVLLYDLPGCARSETPPLPYDVPDYADTLESFMDAMDVPSAHVFSCGGSCLTAATFAATRPSRVNKLVLESLIAYETKAERIAWWENKFKHLIDESVMLPKTDGGIFYREKSNLYPELDDRERLEVFAAQDADREAHGRWWVEGLRGTQMRYDVTPHLPRIQAPTLLLYAELSWQRVEDPAFGARMEERVLNAIPDSRMEFVPGTYGETFFERAEAWTALVQDFLHEASELVARAGSR